MRSRHGLRQISSLLYRRCDRRRMAINAHTQADDTRRFAADEEEDISRPAPFIHHGLLHQMTQRLRVFGTITFDMRALLRSGKGASPTKSNRSCDLHRTSVTSLANNKHIVPSKPKAGSFALQEALSRRRYSAEYSPVGVLHYLRLSQHIDVSWRR